MRWDPKNIEGFVAWALDPNTSAEALADELREVPTDEWELCAVRVSVPLFGPMPGGPQAGFVGSGQTPPSWNVTTRVLGRAKTWESKQQAFRAEEDHRGSRRYG